LNPPALAEPLINKRVAASVIAIIIQKMAVANASLTVELADISALRMSDVFAMLAIRLTAVIV